MLNDEQILLKTAKLLENLNIFEQKPDKLLRELDEVELEVLDDVLGEMKGEDLAFNKLFGGEMRKVIPFPTIDTSTELGQFGEFFKKQDFDVDWDKGLVSAERDIRNSDDLLGDLMRVDRGGQEEKKTKKIQMKIGKFFAKVAELSSKKSALEQKVMSQTKLNDPHINITHPRQITGNHVIAALGGAEQKRYQQLVDQISLYIPNPGVAGPAGYNLAEVATKMAKYWQTNAGYIKKEINKLDNDKYSIIITRHPIDVMRMSDFEKITSCHSPPSRGGGSIEYYKCAVAEAMGHGAIAYVVKTEDLLHSTNTSNIESAEQELQEGEIFADDNRQGGAGFDIEPISRTRLRQIRYYDTDTPKRWDDGTELAVPEKRIYGVGIPGIADRVVKWAEENQKEAIRDMPETDEMVNLDRFWMFGGSYEDTSGAPGRRQLLSTLTGIDEMHFTGDIRQNRETEDALDANALSGMEGRYRDEIEEISAEWNRRWANTHVEAEVEDDYEGGFYISVRTSMQWKWDLDEFSKLPNSYPTGMHAFDSINEIWGNIFDSNDAFINNDDSKNVRIGCTINLEHPDVYGDGGAIYDPDELRNLCAELDTKMDDRRDAFQATIEEFLKREGWMEGGEYITLAMEIEDGQLTSYEWELETDGEYSESYESTARYSFDYDPEELGVDIHTLLKLLGSRDYKIGLRNNLLELPRKEVETEYYLQMDIQAIKDAAGDARVTAIFLINADEPDKMAELFRDLVGGDMDDEDNLAVVFNKTLAQIKAQADTGQWGDDVSESLVRRWRVFLR